MFSDTSSEFAADTVKHLGIPHEMAHPILIKELGNVDISEAYAVVDGVVINPKALTIFEEQAVDILAVNKLGAKSIEGTKYVGELDLYKNLISKDELMLFYNNGEIIALFEAKVRAIKYNLPQVALDIDDIIKNDDVLKIKFDENLPNSLINEYLKKADDVGKVTPNALEGIGELLKKLNNLEG